MEKILFQNSNLSIDPELAKLVIEQMSSVVITDINGCYVYGNSEWEVLMGLNIDDVKGINVKEIVPDTKINQALKKGITLSGAVIVNNKPAFSYYSPIKDYDGKVIAGAIITIITGNSKSDYLKKTNELINQLQYYKSELNKIRGAKYSIDSIVGKSNSIMHVKENIRLAAKHRSNVLIQGETGCGKELVAQSIHNLSSRACEPFVTVNCSSIPINLMESIFFGYEEGAFTGAKNKGHIGKFEQANRGSIFLDEISELPIELQPKLLRVLQEREIERIGGRKNISIDVRLITCSNIPLEDLVDSGHFRQDLFYRINVVTINIPPLRERLEDIDYIADVLVDRLNDQLGLYTPYISSDVKRRLREYDWPGNVRELQNAIEYAMNMSGGGNLCWEYFNEYLNTRFKLPINRNINQTNYIQMKNEKYEMERNLIIETLKQMGNNKSKTAKQLGISRTMLYKKLYKHGIM